jgi:hypothetical protein
VARLLTSLAIAAGLAANVPTHAYEIDLSVDVRAVSASTDQTSFLYGGGGKLRFDEQHDGLKLGSLHLGYRGDITDTLRLTADAFAYDDHDVNPIDLTELYLAWRPIPHSLLRHELKLGAFYPAISLENRMSGWRTPYSLTPSAINTWIGEELRTIGMEYDLDWLRQQDGHALNLGFNAAVFGWNDPAGTVMASRGWAMHDRQSSLFGRLGTGQSGSGIVNGRTLFYDEIDGRAGYYVGVSAKYRDTLELRALHYDNRGNPATFVPALNDGAWLTRFNSVGVRFTPDAQWTFMWQRLAGETFFGAPAPANSFNFDSSFVLASWQHHAHRLTLRYDDFQSTQYTTNFFFYINDRGHALTFAWLYELNPHLTLVAESLRINSDLSSRVWVGAPTTADERQLQLALRYEL